MEFDMPTCGGCRTCEMACAFKHTGRYQPAVSSLKVLEREHFQGYRVALAEASGHGQFACDGCPERTVPLCMQFCRKRDDLRLILDRFLQRAAAVRERVVPEAGRSREA